MWRFIAPSKPAAIACAVTTKRLWHIFKQFSATPSQRSPSSFTCGDSTFIQITETPVSLIMFTRLEFSVRTQLRLVFSIIIAMSFVLAFTGIWRLHALSLEVEMLANRSIVKERLISNWLTNIAVAAKRTAVIARANDPALAAFFVEEGREGSEGTAQLQKQIDGLLDKPEERASFNEVAVARARYITLRDRVLALKSKGENAQADLVFMGEFKPAVDAYVDGVARLRTMQHEAIDRDVTAMLSGAKRSTTTLLLTGFVILVFSIATGMAFARSLFRHLGAEPALAKAVSAEIAAGNLSVRIPTAEGDVTSLMAALERMRGGLAGIVRQVHDTSGAIGNSLAFLTDETQALSERTENQAQTLEQIASSVATLTETICKSAASAERVGAQADKAVQRVHAGERLVEQLVMKMNAIDTSTAQIADIVSVIDGIAFQTNLLALNAAVEAARVGSAGRGFAVVAAEVRALAQRSSNAAKEVRALIAVSSHEVANGTALADTAEEAMHEAVDNVSRLATAMRDLAADSRMQASGMAEINHAVVHIDGLTQQNAGLVEQSASTTRDVDVHVRTLGDRVSLFKLNRNAFQLSSN
jgi:methyl-accepting chemotaxis protein